MSLRRSGTLAIAVPLAVLALCARTSAQDGNPPPVGNLSARYKFVERFTTQENKPGFVGQYQVAFRETMSGSDPGGYTRTIRFSERPAAVSDERRPSDVVRHYDSLVVEPDLMKGKPGRRPLDDLTVWIREVPGTVPVVISLSPNRGLLEEEFEFAVTNNYVTKLTFVLPNDPVRIGDSWKVSFAGVAALTNLPNLLAGELTAVLSEVKANPSGTGLQAVIDITGRLEQELVPDSRNSPANETAVRARMLFAFTPPPAGDNGVIEAFGAIEQLSMSQVKTVLDAKTGKKPWWKRELVLERRFPGKDPLLTIPEPPPTPTIENSWLTASAPNGDFHFRHAQEFDFELVRRPPPDEAAGRQVRLVRPTVAGFMPDLITFDFYNSTIPPQAVFEDLKAQWAAGKVEVTPGLARRLPEGEWPEMAVHYMEAVVKAPDQGPNLPVPRRYSYNYVIQFPRNASIVATANTFSDRPEDFHKQAEAILKTLKLGPVPTP